MKMFLLSPAGNLFFSVSERVGKGQTNDVIDVLLVQFFLRKIGERGGVPNDPDAVAKFRAVTPTGKVDDATVAAITAGQQHQRRRHPAVVVDGTISPVGTGSGLYAAAAPYQILHLNSTMRELCPKFWPRLQDVPGCPVSLAAKVTEIV